jgi:GH25 family lysozyme M1 (1,4-beta-N-acetylmuramidase)
MALYQFADISHHKGDLDIQTFANAGHRIVISKASDNYHLPDRNGRYDFAAERHYDSRFVQNFVNTRAAGLVAGAYHFCRFDRPQPIGNRAAIVQANLDYFQIAVNMLPAEHQSEVVTAILDMEQSGSQLQAAGLNRSVISDMAKDIVTLFLENYEQVILYSGSWWTDEWLTRDTTEWMAERVGVWEPEYVTIDDNNPLNPNYEPSVPKGFSNQYALQANDIVGKLFAWQYTAKGRFPNISSNIDLNLTSLPKEELFALFHQDGAVDPPPTPPPATGEELSEMLEGLASLDANLLSIEQLLVANRAEVENIRALVQDIQSRL